MRHDVWAVVKDPGGTNGLLPVVDELRKDGIEVLLVANGKAKEILAHGEREHVAPESVETLLSAYKQKPKVLLTSMCSGGGVGRDLVPLLRGASATVAFQDIWGAHLHTTWADRKYRPDYIVTNDALGKDTILEFWKDFPPEHVLTTGFPALDKYAAMNAEAESRRTRDLLGIRNDIPLVLFMGQGVGTSQVLQEVLDALDQYPHSYCLMPRPHPRIKEDFRTEMALWQRALGRFKGRLVVDWFGACATPQLIAAAAHRGAVVSMYSTALIEAAAVRANAIAVLYPKENILSANPDIAGIEKFPLVSAGCAVGAHNYKELLECLSAAIAGALFQRPMQERAVPLDGQNARRAADTVRCLL